MSFISNVFTKKLVFQIHPANFWFNGEYYRKPNFNFEKQLDSLDTKGAQVEDLVTIRKF